jgi:hypothetical protein
MFVSSGSFEVIMVVRPELSKLEGSWGIGEEGLPIVGSHLKRLFIGSGVIVDNSWDSLDSKVSASLEPTAAKCKERSFWQTPDKDGVSDSVFCDIRSESCLETSFCMIRDRISISPAIESNRLSTIVRIANKAH